jgi:hypothetical protein
MRFSIEQVVGSGIMQEPIYVRQQQLTKESVVKSHPDAKGHRKIASK